MAFFISITIVFLVVTTVLNIFLPQIKGAIGERRIHHLLKQLGESYVAFNDVYVPKKDGRTTQIDHIVVSPYGIFVIETKNYSGWIFGSERQKNWTQTIYKKKSKFYNPILQNESHVNALKHYLGQDLPMISMIVFSNAATFKFKESFEKAKVIQNRQLKKVIQQYTAPIISAQKINEIKQQLETLKNKPSTEMKSIKKEHLQRVKQKANSNVTANAQHSIICPKCNSQLVVRQSKRGKFYGCASFPACRYTKNIE